MKKILNEGYPWINKLYEETSGFIHLSKKHIFTSSKLIDNEAGIVELRISKKDNYVPDSARIEAIKGMIEITNLLCSFIEEWIWIKNNPGKNPNDNI